MSQRRLLGVVALCLFTTAAACGTEEGSTESSGDTGSGSDETSFNPDSTTPDTTIPDTNPPEDTSPPLDTSAPDTSIPPDTTPPPDTGPPDTGAVIDLGPPDLGPPANACGGTAVLTGKPGDTCGTCTGATLKCVGTDKLECDDVKNVCGGCAKLPAVKPGEPCGTCGGKVTCVGTEELLCLGGSPTNGCVGCSTLTPALGTACGVCGSGAYVCDTTETTKCADPVSTPKPGDACGTCKSSKYVCAADKKSTVCEKTDDTNACGGCGTLTAKPGDTCGACGSQVCSADKTKLSCKEAVPVVGEPCGVCGTSKIMCFETGKTVCTKNDDRVLLDELSTPGGTSSLGYSLKRAFSWTTSTDSLVNPNVTIRAESDSYYSGYGTSGDITLVLFLGNPLSPGDEIGRVTKMGVSLSSSISTLVFNFTTTTPIPAGTEVFIEESATMNYDLVGTYCGASIEGAGGSATCSGGFPNFRFWYDSGGWSEASVIPNVTVTANGCAAATPPPPPDSGPPPPPPL